MQQRATDRMKSQKGRDHRRSFSVQCWLMKTVIPDSHHSDLLVQPADGDAVAQRLTLSLRSRDR